MHSFSRWLSDWPLKTLKSIQFLSIQWRKHPAYDTKSTFARQCLSTSVVVTLFESIPLRTPTFTISISSVPALTTKSCTRYFLRMKSYGQQSRALPAQKLKWRWTCLYLHMSSTKSSSKTRLQARKRKSKSRWRKPSRADQSQAQVRTLQPPPRRSWMPVKQALNLWLLSRRALWLEVAPQLILRLRTPLSRLLTLMVSQVQREPVLLKREFLLQAMISW